MSCRTCTHYYPARGDGAGACMSMKSTLPLFDDPERCGDFLVDLAVAAQDRKREEQSRQPVRVPERWISEQTELKLNRQHRDWHGRTDR